ncbi:unnamed protein product, partial [Ectocarpus fasciculatus]
MPRRKAANPIRRNVTGDGIGGRPPAPAPGPPADGRLSPSSGVGALLPSSSATAEAGGLREVGAGELGGFGEATV